MRCDLRTLWLLTIGAALSVPMAASPAAAGERTIASAHLYLSQHLVGVGIDSNRLASFTVNQVQFPEPCLLGMIGKVGVVSQAAAVDFKKANFNAQSGAAATTIFVTYGGSALVGGRLVAQRDTATLIIMAQPTELPSIRAAFVFMRDKCFVAGDTGFEVPGNP